ncbi:MAG: hypothetical protein ISR95_03485 [Candidatus Marinimicrobia bacterium]|nr:hypothetical protein [Candidatus Brocadiales bacterium]MBL7046677.1 hypothetical protein [Candidatus Neomarinimicrobiota bacterium]
MTIHDIKQTLDKLPDDLPIAYVMWLPEDVDAEARSISVKLNHLEIEDVLINMQDNADYEFGMTWTSVRCSIENIIKNRL